MPLPPPASVGNPLDQIDTPALVLDLGALESNIALMADTVRKSGVRLRPHAKSHKCAEIARRQIAAGAVGVCCQKASEAEALVAGGVADVPRDERDRRAAEDGAPRAPRARSESGRA